MASLTALAPPLLQRARADQVATLFAQWPRTTASMALGGAILITVMWGTVPASAFAVWFAAILLNQAWRFQLVRRYRAAAPAEAASGRWGRASALGSTLAGALWGCAGVMLFVPGDPGHQALVIVCLFGVILGGHQSHLGLQAGVLWFRPAGAVAADRARRRRGRSTAFLYRRGHAGRARLHSGFRTQPQQPDDAVADDTLRERRPDRRAHARDRCGRSRARHRRSRQSRQDAVPRRGEPRPAPAVARDGPVRRRAGGAGRGSGGPRNRRLHQRIGRGAGAAVHGVDGHIQAGRRRGGSVARQISAGAAVRAARARIRSARRGARPAPRGSCPPAYGSTAIRYCSSACLPTLFRTRCATPSAAARSSACVDAAGQVAIEVRDTGAGIPAAERERIFEAFYQIRPATRDAGQGMGLGLAIIRRLAALLDHPIEVDSTPARGSRFAVVVPRAAARAACSPAATSEGLYSAHWPAR